MKTKNLFIAGIFVALMSAMLYSFKPSTAPPDKSGQSLGTVIASVLDYDHLAKINGDPSVIDPKVSNWIPADGRDISGSALSKQTGSPTAPDLRGRFLRGLNTMYSDGQPELKISTADQGDPLSNRKAGKYQEDAVGPHSHAIDMGTGYMMDLGDWQHVPHPPMSIYIADRPAWRSKYGNITAKPDDNPASETRPKNISVY